MDGKELFWELAATVANTKASEEETGLFAQLAYSRLTDDPDSATDTLIAALHEGVSAVVVAAYGMQKTATTRDRDIEPEDLHHWLAAIREGTEKVRNG